ncbi:uncharacterized protein [Solanum lycopersicum]|uniref:uncharacterized protein n=1 Tax=Solanum lycopersicum TaxID=4081 RepID=UPI003748BE35
MLRAYVIDFRARWDDNLPLIQFSYHNGYRSSIRMAPFKVMYGISCKSHVGWFEVGESSILGPEIIHSALEKVRMISDRLATAYSRQKSYADNRNWTLEFDVSDQRVGEVSSELALPTELASVHPVFHVSMLKKCLGDPTSILPIEGLGSMNTCPIRR